MNYAIIPVMANKNLSAAKSAKNDEFYAQFADINNEINAYTEYNPDVFCGKTVLCPCDDPEWSNFTKFFAKKFDEFGLKKLISTSTHTTPRIPSPTSTGSPRSLRRRIPPTMRQSRHGTEKSSRSQTKKSFRATLTSSNGATLKATATSAATRCAPCSKKRTSW